MSTRTPRQIASLAPASSAFARKFGLSATLVALAFSLLGATSAQAQMLSLPGEKPASGNSLPSSQPATANSGSTSGHWDETSPHALAVRARWVTVPGWELAPYTDSHTQLNGGWSVGLEYLYRMRSFDVVISLDYSWLNADNGNFLAKGHDPATDTHFISFDRLSAISADVSLIGHWNLTSWLEIRVGAGLGLGVVLGNMYQITSSGCTLGNVNDTSNCYPRTQSPRPAYNVSQPLPDQNSPTVYCNADLSDSKLDTANTPCLRRVETYPLSGRAVPVLNAMFGFRFRAHKNVYVHLETGWRLVGFFLGAGPEFRF